MDTDVKERWVAALRSGEYTQAKGNLKVKLEGDGRYGHCCLGVLCDLAAEDGIIEPAVWVADTESYTDEDRASIASGTVSGPVSMVYRDNLDPTDVEREYWQGEVLPLAVQRWAGLHAQNPSVIIPNDSYDPEVDESEEETQAVELAELNDDQGFSFEDIAYAIEQDGAF